MLRNAAPAVARDSASPFSRTRRENAARFGLARVGVVFRFEAEERIFQRGVKIGRIFPHGFAEFVARAVAVAGFQQRVSKVFPDVGALRRERGCLTKINDGGVVIVEPQCIEGGCQREVCGVGRRRGRLAPPLPPQAGRIEQRFSCLVSSVKSLPCFSHFFWLLRRGNAVIPLDALP